MDVRFFLTNVRMIQPEWVQCFGVTIKVSILMGVNWVGEWYLHHTCSSNVGRKRIIMLFNIWSC